MSAKPIVLVYFPDRFVAGGNDRNWIYDYMAFLNGEAISNNRFSFGKHDFTDYHWFCFYKDIDEPRIQVFYEKDFTEIQYEELKKLITDAIENQKQQP